MRPLVILLILIFAFSGEALLAQDKADTLKFNSLNEVVSLAIKNNPTQAVYQQQINQAKYNYKASKGFIYPSASGSFIGTDNLHLAVTPIPGELIGKPGTTFYAQFGKQFNYGTGITLGQDIIDWQSIFQAEIANNNIKLNELQQDSYIQGLKDQVGKLYFSTLTAKASLQIINTDRLLADSIVNLNRERFNEGTIDAIALNQEIISANNVLQNQAQSQQLYDQSIENLKILLGEKPENDPLLTESLNLESLSIDNNITLNNDKNLDVYKQQIDIAGLQSKSQRSVAYPKLSASMYLGAQQYRDNFGLSFSSNAWNPYRYIGLSLTVPIFTGFTNSNKYKSALVQQNIAQLQYNSAKQQSEINDRLLIKNHNDYFDQVKASASNFKLYRSNLQLTKQKYLEGVIGMDVYLKAFQDYLTAENLYLSNLSTLLSTKATILSRQ